MAKNTTTRWDALSMRDRASLIKLYSQSGIKKLDDMRAHYNRFDTGGDKTNDLFFNPDYSSNNPQYKVGMKTEPLHVERSYTPDDFFDRWYPNRIRQIQNNLAVTNRIKDRIFPNKIAGRDARPFINSMLRNAKLVKEYTLLHPGNYDSEKNFMFPNALKDSVARNMLNDSVRAKNRILGKEIMEDYPDEDLRWEAYGTYGFSKPSYPHHIFYTTAKPSENTIVHERTHPLRPELGSELSKRYMTYPLFTGDALNPMELKINSLIAHDQLRMSEKGEKLNSKDASYYFSPEELNARMNAIREQQNINPKHTITKEDLQEIKEKASYKDRDGFLDLLDDDSLLKLFNDVASTNEKVDMSNIAANGGSIHNNKFETGGDKQNDALAKAIIDRVNQEEAAKAKAESLIMGEAPLENEDYLLGAAAASTYGLATAGLNGAGRAIARGLNWFGEKAMPSALLKSPVWKGATAKALSAVAPYADAAALSYWSAKGLNNAIQEWNNGNKIGAAANATLASLPAVAVTAPHIDNIANTIKYAIKQGIPNVAKYSKIVNRRLKSGAWEDGIKFARDKYASRADMLDKNFKMAEGMTEAQATDPNIPRVVGSADVLNKLPKIKIANPLIGILSNEGGHYSRGIHIFSKPKPSITLNPYNLDYVREAFNGQLLRPLRRLNFNTAHEGTHWALDQLRTFGGTRLGRRNSPIVEGISAPSSEYYIANPKHPLFKTTTNIFNDTSRKIGWWERNPEEFVAEQTAAQFRMGISPELSYKDWDARNKLKINKFLGVRFGMNPEQATNVSEGLSSFGYKNGGQIYIKPENRGKFNALLKRTGKSASWFKEHGTPLQRKRATFALNARKWKHPDGGEINVLGNPSYNKAQEEYMYRYLKDSGMDDTHVAAIMGNIAVESGLNADKKQIKGPAWGLIQAEGSRQEAIKNYNDVPYLFGSKLSPEEQRQLDYIIEKGIRTYTPGEWGIAGFKGARQARNGFINETDLTKATDIFMRNYERPSKQHRSWRQNMSKYYYDKYKEPEYYVQLDFFNK